MEAGALIQAPRRRGRARQHHRQEAALAAATSHGRAAGAKLTSFTLDRQGVRVRVRKRARTLLLHRVEATRGWVLVSADGSSGFS